MIAGLVLALAATVFSGVENQVRVPAPRLDPSSGPVRIDGVLDEEVWQQAAILTGFSQYSPVDGRAAENRTDVLVFYSPTTIYFGIRAHAAPGTVHATLANRDKIDADDSIQIFLNPFNDGRQALVFGVNPLGIQADGALVEGSGNRGGGAVRRARKRPRGHRPDARLRLPVEGPPDRLRLRDRDRHSVQDLRYPAGRTQSWALNVSRRVQSDGLEDTWTPAQRAKSSFLGQSGTLDGLTDLHRGLVLDLNPFVDRARPTARRPATDWRYDASRPEFGGNVRWGVTPNLTMNGTINPDFSQVEADAGQFTFDPRSALFFPEKRPFFLDGAEQFNTPNNLIYTRRIVAPEAAVKLTGKVVGDRRRGPFGASMTASTSLSAREHPVFNIVRLQHDLPRSSKVGMVYTDRIEGAEFEPRVRGRRAPAVRIDLQPAAAGRRQPHRRRRQGDHRRRSGRRFSTATAGTSATATRRRGSTKTFKPPAASSAAAASSAPT